MTTEIDDPEWEDVLEDAIDAQIALVETGFPAIVVSYDHGKHKATIAPIIQDRFVDPEDGTVTHVLGDPIANVPRAPQCSSAHGVTFPLERGDVVWCSVAQRSMDEYKTNGDKDAAPALPRKHDRDDAVIVALLHPFNSPPPSAAIAAGKLVVYSESEVLLGDSSASEFVALASLVVAEINALRNDFNLHTHVVAGITAGAASVTSATGLPQAGAVGSVAADKVKAT